MKRKARKATANKWTILGLLAFGIGVGLPFYEGVLQGQECHTKSDCGTCCQPQAARSVQHELVPHVVLPETIQYNKISRSHRTHPGLDSAGDYGMVSPYVATYTPFPSYQLPLAAQMKAVNQSVYPVSPQAKPLPLPAMLPEKAKPKEEPAEMVLEERDTPESDTDVAPILLASAGEKIVPATPLSPVESQVTQTGIFCEKPAKPPAAWSFNSPLFKVASVPMGWGVPGNNASISQCGPMGVSQVGFNPMTAGGCMPGMMPGMMAGPPMNTFRMGAGAAAGPQVQMLPNGMLMVSTPANHSQCGIFRCRCGNQPQTAFLPPAMGGMPGMMPGGMPEAMPQQMPQMPQQPNLAPQMEPVTMMTQFGPMLVGYRPAAMMNPMMAHPAYAWQMQQRMAQQQWAQYQAMQQMAMQQQQYMQYVQYAQYMQQMAAAQAGQSATAKDSSEPKAPRPIDGPNLSALMANPYALYSQQTGADGLPKIQGENAENQAEPTNPTMETMPGMMPYNPAEMGMMPYGMPCGMPYGTMCGMDPWGMGCDPTMMGGGCNPYMMAGCGSMGMSDVVQLAMLLNNNNGKRERRFRIFQRLAERREERRARRSSPWNDPMNQLMQAWTTPYMASDMVARMPSRNMYPYGYFGAQVGPQETANYGGFYNFYTGNTTLPGLY